MSAGAETPSTDSSLERSESKAAQVPTVKPAVTSSATVDQLAVNDISSVGQSEPQVTNVSPVRSAVTSSVPSNSLGAELTKTLIPQETLGLGNGQPTQLAGISEYQTDSQSLQPATQLNNQPTSSEAARSSLAPPIPGTVETSASALTATPKTAVLPEGASGQADSTVAQTNIDPGRPTRGGYSYIAVGGNIGLGGGSSLGDGAFAVTSKIGLTPTISFRPGAVIGDETVFLVPVTYDFVIQSADPFAPIPFAPYLGGGVAVTTDGDVGFLLTGGVDVPLSRQFIANAAVNVDFGSDTNVGLFLGVGYTFPNLFQR
jgi:hypothetical protein